MSKTTWILGGALLAGLGIAGYFVYTSIKKATDTLAASASNAASAGGASAATSGVDQVFTDLFGTSKLNLLNGN